VRVRVCVSGGGGDLQLKSCLCVCMGELYSNPLPKRWQTEE